MEAAVRVRRGTRRRDTPPPDRPSFPDSAIAIGSQPRIQLAAESPSRFRRRPSACSTARARSEDSRDTSAPHSAQSACPETRPSTTSEDRRPLPPVFFEAIGPRQTLDARKDSLEVRDILGRDVITVGGAGALPRTELCSAPQRRPRVRPFPVRRGWRGESRQRLAPPRHVRSCQSARRCKTSPMPSRKLTSARTQANGASNKNDAEVRIAAQLRSCFGRPQARSAQPPVGSASERRSNQHAERTKSAYVTSLKDAPGCTLPGLRRRFQHAGRYGAPRNG